MIRCEHEDGRASWADAGRCPDPATVEVRVWFDAWDYYDLDLCAPHADEALKGDPDKVERL